MRTKCEFLRARPGSPYSGVMIRELTPRRALLTVSRRAGAWWTTTTSSSPQVESAQLMTVGFPMR